MNQDVIKFIITFYLNLHTNMKYVIFIYLHIYLLSKCFGNSNTSIFNETLVNHGSNEKIQRTHQISAETWRPWISGIFSEAEKQFTIHSEAGTKCKHDFNLYELHLKNHSLWAIRMFESSQWPKFAILMGMKPLLGHFDECVMINAYNIQGQHCIVENEIQFEEFEFARPKHPFDAPPEESSAWFALQMYEHDEYRMQRNLFQWSLCIPSSCSELDLTKSLALTLNDVFGKYSINVRTDVKKGQCHIRGREYSVEYYPVIYFFTFLALLVILSSIFMQFQDKNTTSDDEKLPMNVIKCFSIQENYNKLIQIVPEQELMLIQVYRVAISVMIVMLHRFFYMIGYIQYNANFIERLPHLSENTHFYSIDPVGILFFISGVLAYKGFITSNKNDAGILENIVKRWFRLFPSYFIVRLLYTFILPTISNGPMWHELRNEVAHCKSNFLRALLALPSERNWDTMCYPISWTIPVDFQLYIVGYILLSSCKHFKIDKFRSLLFSMITSCVVTFCYIFYNQYMAVVVQPVRPLGVLRTGHKLNTNFPDFISFVYTSAIIRLSPYLMGMLVASMTDKLKSRRYVFPKVLIICGFILTEGMRIATGVSFCRLSEQYIAKVFNRGWHAVHAATFQPLSILSTAFLFLVYFVNGFEYLEKRIPRIIMPLGRLCFAVNTSHMVLIHLHVFSRQTITSDTDLYSLVYLFVSDIVLSYVLAFIMHLVIEAPAQRLCSLLTSVIRNSKTQQRKEKMK